MSQDYAMEMIRHMLWMALVVVGPILLIGLIVGVTVGVVQAATQIQESSLNFVPKLLVIGLVLAIGGPWFLDKMVTFTGTVLQEIAYLTPRGMG